MGGDIVVQGFSQHADGRVQARVFRFTVPGEPVSKPRQTRRDKWEQRECVVRYRAWADLARLHARMAGTLPPAETIKELRCTCYFLPPESWNAKSRSSVIGERHNVRPDVDNLAKAVLDSLFKQDQAIADLVVRKRYDWTPRVEIEIEYAPAG